MKKSKKKRNGGTAATHLFLFIKRVNVDRNKLKAALIVNKVKFAYELSGSSEQRLFPLSVEATASILTAPRMGCKAIAGLPQH